MTTLILGAPGSGKTYFVEKIKPIYSEIFDADYDIPGLSGWTDADGNGAVFPTEPTIAWLDTHFFQWNSDVLKKFLEAHPNAIVCGIAANAFELAHLFDRAYYLLIDPETLKTRMLSGERKNKRGKSLAEIEQISRAITEEHIPQARAHGVSIIDGLLSPTTIFNSILPIHKG